MKQSECPVCRRDVLADFPGLRSVCPQCEKKLALKEEFVDLRMHLANAENQALKIVGLLPVKYYSNDAWGLASKTYLAIREADNKICELAEIMELDKIGLVEPRKVN